MRLMRIGTALAVLAVLASAPLLSRDRYASAADPIVVGSVSSSPASVKVVDGSRGVDVTYTVKISGGRAPYTVRWTTDRGVLCENCNPLQANTTRLRFAGDSFFAFFTITDADGQKASWKGDDGVPRSEFSVGVGPNGLTTAPAKLPSVPGAATAATPAAAAPNTSAPAPAGSGKPDQYKDSGARFSGISGQVEVRESDCDGEDCWRLVKYDTVLHVGMHIRTQEMSTAVIGFADFATHVLKPESEIVITEPPAKVTSLQILGGNIWTNVKKMVKDGSMEVEMNQAAATIKGTTFTLGERDGVSTLQVLEGTVDFRAKAGGKQVTLTAGQASTATKSGLGDVKPFDVQAAAADWDAVRVRTEQGQLGNAPAAWYRSTLTLIAVGVAVLILGAAGVWIARKGTAR